MAKHVDMKKTKQVPADGSIPQITRVTRMLRRIQPWLQSQRFRVATFAEMESWSNIPEGTIRAWFAGEGNPTAELLLTLLERVPEDARFGLLGEFCRVYPTLDHPRLGDRTVISRLSTVLSQSRGFSYIQGGSEETRTFMISALGHSFWRLTSPPRRVLGVDVHASDWFVPVPGATYLDNILQRDDLRRAVQSAWPQFRNGETPLVLFNGVWGALPDLQDKIRALAERCHVLVADASPVEVEQAARRLPIRGNVISIVPSNSEQKSIALAIRAL